jgi:hypothetical protein
MAPEILQFQKYDAKVSFFDGGGGGGCLPFGLVHIDVQKKPPRLAGS